MASRRTAQRLAGVEESATFAIADRVKQLAASGVDVLDLSGGDPDFNTAPHIIGAAEQALRSGFTHYAPSRGIPELRSAVSHHLRDLYGMEYDPASEIIITPSAKHALFISLLTILNPGDELLIPSPAWVSYEAMTKMVGAEPILVEMPSTGGFQLVVEEVERHLSPRTRAVLINTPNNPTGAVYEEPALRRLAELAEERDLFIISDEIYDRFTFDDRQHLSPAAFAGARGRTLVVNGFSKSYAMTGWRLGFVACPADVSAELLKAQQHTVGCAASFTQHAAVVALESSQECVAQMAATYLGRRRIVVDSLNAMPGLRCSVPQGSFYAFPSFHLGSTADSMTFSNWLLDRAGVAVTPGVAFGPGGEGHIRVSFATATDKLVEALDRIRTVLVAESSSAC